MRSCDKIHAVAINKQGNYCFNHFPLPPPLLPPANARDEPCRVQVEPQNKVASPHRRPHWTHSPLRQRKPHRRPRGTHNLQREAARIPPLSSRHTRSRVSR